MTDVRHRRWVIVHDFEIFQPAVLGQDKRSHRIFGPTVEISPRLVTSPTAPDWLVTAGAACEKRNAGKFQAIPWSPARSRRIDRLQTAGRYSPYCDVG